MAAPTVFAARGAALVRMRESSSNGAIGANRAELARRAALAASVVAIWLIALLPSALGWQKCAFARIVRRPCPGCGMTRAIRLLVEGHVQASLRMHPLAFPMIVAGTLLILSTTAATFTRGSPLLFYRTGHGRAAIALAAIVYAAMFGLWVLRAFGAFGGPVAVVT